MGTRVMKNRTPLPWWKRLLRFLGFRSAQDNNKNKLTKRVKSGTNTNQFERLPGAVYLQPDQVFSLDKSDQKYTVVRELDQGGYGTIFIIQDGKRKLALKILDLWKKQPPEWKNLADRFKNSYKAGFSTSPYLIKYFQKGTYQGNPCVVMEYCSGGNLEERINDFQQVIPFKQLCTKLLKGLTELHHRGIIHRDLKPKNIIFDAVDNPKITDFDLSAFLNSRATVRNRRGHVQEVWFTGIYAPPEQLDPRQAYGKAKPSMDMFALGVTLYEVSTGGSYPWGTIEEYHADRDAYQEKINQGAFKSLLQLRPDLGSDWASTIDRCLHPDPQKRIASPGDFLARVAPVKVVVPTVPPTPTNDVRATPVNPSSAQVWGLEILKGTGSDGEIINLGDCMDDNQHILIGRSSRFRSGAGRIKLDESERVGSLPHLSRRHLTLKKVAGNWMIRDGQYNTETRQWNRSSNGTTIRSVGSGGNQVVPYEEYIPLKPDDVVSLADEVLLKFTAL